jgi:hypothetical protein
MTKARRGARAAFLVTPALVKARAGWLVVPGRAPAVTGMNSARAIAMASAAVPRLWHAIAVRLPRISVVAIVVS